MRETDIQNQIRCELSKYGIVIRMNTGNFELKDGRRIYCGVKGLSDLLFIGHGFVAFIEVKNEKGKATPEQLNFIDKVKKLWHNAGICRSVDEALSLIEKTKECTMKSEEIIKLAMKNKPMPDILTSTEQFLFLNIRALAYQYENKIITREQARAEKLDIINKFELINLYEKIYSNHRSRILEISPLLVQANKSGCEICKKMAMIFDGSLPVVTKSTTESS